MEGKKENEHEKRENHRTKRTYVVYIAFFSVKHLPERIFYNLGEKKLFSKKNGFVDR